MKKSYALQGNISDPTSGIEGRINELLGLGDVLWYGGGGMSLDPQKAPEQTQHQEEASIVGIGPSAIRQRIVSIAESQIPSPPQKGESWSKQDYSKYMSVVRPEDRKDYEGKKVYWCGIFALWVFHQAGILQDVMWEPGKGFLYRLPQTENPKPGDLGYLDRRNHHSIVKAVDGNDVVTIDGNSMWGRVAQNKRKLSDFQSFHSIGQLIGESEG